MKQITKTLGQVLLVASHLHQAQVVVLTVHQVHHLHQAQVVVLTVHQVHHLHNQIAEDRTIKWKPLFFKCKIKILNNGLESR